MWQGCKNRVACVSRADNWKRIYGRTRGQPGFTYLWNLDIGIYVIVSWRVVKTHHMHCSIHRHDKINQTFNNVTGKPTFFFGMRTTKYSVRTAIFWKVVVLRTTTFWSDFYGPVWSWFSIRFSKSTVTQDVAVASDPPHLYVSFVCSERFWIHTCP